VLISSDDGYAFRHALIRESVQASLLPGERGRWHARLAEALGADPALAPDGRAAAEIAHHWQAAGQAASTRGPRRPRGAAWPRPPRPGWPGPPGRAQPASSRRWRTTCCGSPPSRPPRRSRCRR
jgi:hypothetical protein